MKVKYVLNRSNQTNENIHELTLSDSFLYINNSSLRRLGYHLIDMLIKVIILLIYYTYLISIIFSTLYI